VILIVSPGPHPEVVAQLNVVFTPLATPIVKVSPGGATDTVIEKVAESASAPGSVAVTTTLKGEAVCAAEFGVPEINPDAELMLNPRPDSPVAENVRTSESVQKRDVSSEKLDPTVPA
jgi:hypothetical protein